MIDFIKFLLGAVICMGGCIGLMKWIDTWEVEEKEVEEKEVEEKEVKKEATSKIQAVIDRREWFLKKKKEEEEQIKKEMEMSLIYKGLSPSEIQAEIKGEECFRKYVLLGNLSVGSKNDYFDFLDLYIEHGGSASHHYKNNIEESLKQHKNMDNMIYIARNEIEIFPSHGSLGKMIIVMPDCKVISGYGARNQFYCYDDISNQKYAFWIPTYKDWVKRWN